MCGSGMWEITIFNSNVIPRLIQLIIVLQQQALYVIVSSWLVSGVCLSIETNDAVKGAQ